MRFPTWVSVVLIILLLAGAGIGLAYWFGAPRLLEVSPPDGATALPAGVALRLEFSRPMQPESVTQRLSITPSRPGAFEWQGETLLFTPAQPWEAGTEVQAVLQPGAQASAWLAAPMRQSVSWSFRIRQPELAYLYPSTGPASIYVLNPLSGVSAPLVENLGAVQDFVIGPSGTTIYFSSRIATDRSAIYRLDLSTSETLLGEPEDAPGAAPAQVVDCPQALCQGVALSPDGRYLAYERGSLPGSGKPSLFQVWVLPLEEGGGEAFLAGDAQRETLLPAWSSTGVLSFYDLTARAFIFYDLQNGVQASFPNQTGQSGSWHPNGREFIAPEIIFTDENVAESVEDLPALANSYLFSFDWLGNHAVNLTPGLDVEDAAPAFSPNGNFLAFTRKFLDPQRWTPGRQIWILHMSSRQAQQMTDDPTYNHFNLSWSPAGGLLAYVRFNQDAPIDPPELWLMDVLTGRAIQIAFAAYSPQWIP
jgi:Tol biopolymer transport system component